MSTVNHDTHPHDPAFPQILDDDAPQGTATSEPTQPSVPGDDYLGSRSPGVTASEALAGETLAWKLEREQPEGSATAEANTSSDRFPEAEENYDPDRDGDDNHGTQNRLYDQEPSAFNGRLTDPDEGAHTDEESEAVANGYYAGEDDLSAEEAAMHVEFER